MEQTDGRTPDRCLELTARHGQQNKYYANKNVEHVQPKWITFALAWRQCSTAGAVGSSANSAKPDNDDSRTPMDFSNATRNSDTVVEPSKLTTLSQPQKQCGQIK